MTVSNTTRNITYTGNGVTTDWDFAFYAEDANAIKVYLLTVATNSETELSASQYTLVFNDDNAGGTVTYPKDGSGDSPLTSATKITIQRETAQTQPLQLTNQSAYNPAELESALDRLTYLAQEVKELVGRTLTLPPGSTVGTLTELYTSLTDAVTAAEAAAAVVEGFPETIGTLGRSLIEVENEATFKALVNLEPGTDVQAYDADLAAIAGASWAQGDLITRGAAALQRLAAGTAGKFLMSNGTGADVSWEFVNTIYPFIYEYTSSGTLTAAEDCQAMIVAVGAAGSGGAVRSSSSASATGGAAGGIAILETPLVAAQALTITPGTGGAARTTTSGSLAGNPGTATTVVDGGSINISAGGGNGGNAGAGAQAAAAGGTATGGDFNFTGGASGSTSGVNMATGGGAVGLTGTGNASGNRTSAGATGGAGVGTASSTNSLTGGLAPVLISALLGLNVTQSAGGTGVSAAGTAANGGPFAGGGAAYEGGTGSATGGDGGLGAGGGAAFVNTSGTATSGKGGNGFVVVFLTKPKA